MVQKNTIGQSKVGKNRCWMSSPPVVFSRLDARATENAWLSSTVIIESCLIHNYAYVKCCSRLIIIIYYWFVCCCFFIKAESRKGGCSFFCKWLLNRQWYLISITGPLIESKCYWTEYPQLSNYPNNWYNIVLWWNWWLLMIILTWWNYS